METGVPHFDSKFEIEKIIVSSIVKYTILRPASFYENHLIPEVVKGIKKGKYITPLLAKCTQQMIGVDDLGKIACQVMLHSEKYLNKTLSLATAEYQIGDIPKLFTEATLNPVKYKKIPKIIVRLVMGKKLYKMFDYMNQNDFCVVPDIQKIREAFSIESDFKDWVNLNFKPE